MPRTSTKPQTKRQIAAARQVAAAAATAQRKRDELNQIEANTYGVPLEVWKHLSQEQRRDFARTRPKGYVDPQKRVIPQAAADEELTGSDSDLEGMEERLRGRVATEADTLDWTTMFDPAIDHPVYGMVHPGTSRIPRRQMDAKFDQGFRFEPEWPLIPEPTIPCGMPGLLDPVCPFLGRPDRDDPNHSMEVEQHQQSRHPAEVTARKGLQEREDRRVRLELQQQQVELTRMQTEALKEQLAALAAAKGS